MTLWKVLTYLIYGVYPNEDLSARVSGSVQTLKILMRVAGPHVAVEGVLRSQLLLPQPRPGQIPSPLDALPGKRAAMSLLFPITGSSLSALSSTYFLCLSPT